MSRSAVIAARNESHDPDTTEIAALADAAGYDVERTLTQVRPPDPATNLGSGKVDELAAACRAVDAAAAVLDVELTPRQTFELGNRLPEGVEVYDRRQLILDIFAAQASTKRARLELDLVELRWELERRRERIRRGGVEYQAMHTIRDPEGEYVREVKQRIDEVKRKLDDCPDRLAERRDRRRDAGFDHVALAGYTNAGKSTLLHRLADDLDVTDARADDPTAPAADTTDTDTEDAGVEGSIAGSGHRAAHDDLGEATAAAEDRLFKTLETTTRRATVDGRRLLVSDTVGFIADLPHDLVESFRTTLGEVRHADVVVIVVDATKHEDALRSRVETVVDVISDELTDDTAAADAGDAELVVALNKVDALPGVERGRPMREGARVDTPSQDGTTHGSDEHASMQGKMAVVESVTPGAVPVVPTSALTGSGIDGLQSAIVDALPTERATLTVPNDGDGQRAISWMYDHATVDSVSYGEVVEIEIRGRPEVVDRARARARDLQSTPSA